MEKYTEEITPEQISKNYTSALDSVDLIIKLKSQTKLSKEDIDTIDRNVEHLKIMLAKDYWTNEDLTLFKEAIK